MGIWAEHGTKILGAITTLLGGILVIDAADPNFLPSLFGEWAPRVIVVVTGALTILRGFSNTAAISRGDFVSKTGGKL